MQRIFTKTIGRYKAGDIYDWPRVTWEHFARSVNQSLSAFTESVEAAADRSIKERRKPDAKHS